MGNDSLATTILQTAGDSTFNFWYGWPAVDHLRQYSGPTDGELLSGALILIVLFGLLVLGVVYTIKLIRS